MQLASNNTSQYNQNTRRLITSHAPRYIATQPFFNSSEHLTISCSHNNFMMISQTVQELWRWQTNKHPQTNHNENIQLAMLQRVPLTYYRRDLLTRVYKATCLTVLGLRIELHSVFRVRPMGRRPGCRTAILPRHLERSNGQIVSGIGNYVREDEFTLSWQASFIIACDCCEHRGTACVRNCMSCYTTSKYCHVQAWSAFYRRQYEVIRTRNSAVDEIGERYRLNHAIVVKLYHSYTQFPRNVRLSHRRNTTSLLRL